MMRTIGRLLWVPLAFLLSAILAAFVLFSLGSERMTRAISGKADSPDAVFEVLELFGQGIVLASGLSIVPAVALIIIGEVARIRSAIYYVVGGGLALAAIPLLAGAATGGGMTMPPTVVLQVLATAGFAGGWLYWMLAGRSA